MSLQRIVATVPYRLVRVLSEIAWFRQQSRLLSQPGFPVVDYFRFGRRSGQILNGS